MKRKFTSLFIAIIMIFAFVVPLSAGNNLGYINYANSSIAYLFFSGVNFDNFEFRYFDGNPVNSNLSAKIISKVDKQDFDAAFALVVQYDLSLFFMPPTYLPIEALSFIDIDKTSIAHIAPFHNRFPVTPGGILTGTCTSGSNHTRALQVIVIVSGLLSFNDNGTVTPIGAPVVDFEHCRMATTNVVDFRSSRFYFASQTPSGGRAVYVNGSFNPVMDNAFNFGIYRFSRRVA